MLGIQIGKSWRKRFEKEVRWTVVIPHCHGVRMKREISLVGEGIKSSS